MDAERRIGSRGGFLGVQQSSPEMGRRQRLPGRGTTSSSSSYAPNRFTNTARCSSGESPVLVCGLIIEISLIPLLEFSDAHIMHKYEVKPDPETVEIITAAASQKEITVLVKIYWGGLGKLKRAIMGSVSNYVVNNAQCPVTVVKNTDNET
ncbi:hypothetical protein M0R45_021124 [Rubus argutus]|uniref:UspA domain-containing protein n=1 Tax=Rubus argutus TaxID=59490 RepID=A0AAW1XC50_RUBAR